MSVVCYFCGKPAQSVEHVPPKALFPESKDCPSGVDYRKNLITVPSCDKHNSSKSHQDEYIMYILAMSLQSNQVARLLFRTKVTRAINRNARLIRMLLKEHVKVGLHDTKTNTWTDSIALKIDFERLTSAFTHIAKAIYFNETQSVHTKKIVVHSEFLLDFADQAGNDKQRKISSELDLLLIEQPLKGDNPDVFSYQVISNEDNFIIRLNFYGETKVYAIFSLIP